MKKLYLHFFLSVFSFFFLCGCSEVIRSGLLPDDPNLSGWTNLTLHPTELEKVSFGIQNNSDFFYLLLSIKDEEMIEKISRHGLELWMDRVRKKDVSAQKRLGMISFPASSAGLSEAAPLVMIASNEKKRGTPGNLLEPQCFWEKNKRELVLKYRIPLAWVRKNLSLGSLPRLMLGFVVNENLEVLDFDEATLLRTSGAENKPMGEEGGRPPRGGGRGRSGGSDGMMGGGRGGMGGGRGGPPPAGAEDRPDSAPMQNQQRRMSMRGEIPVLMAQELWVQVKPAKAKRD